MMLKRSCTWNLKHRCKVMNFEVESRNGIFNVKYDRLRVDWMEQNHIILRKVMMSYLGRHCKVALEDLFGRVYVIGL